MYFVLSLTFGSLIGLSLGLTGGGGAIFAVPLLVYGLGVPARDATGISLAAVGATSVIGFVQRLRLGQVEMSTGLWFAVAGMLGAPLGSYLATWIHETVLLLLFACLMAVVATRLWRQAVRAENPPDATGAPPATPLCSRDPAGELILSPRCVVILLILGLAAGILAGLFGVGGGFIIVPALVLCTGMNIHRAVGTSLMVVALVGLSGVIAHLASGREITLDLTVMFVVGGVAGLMAGERLGQRMSGPMLQKVFAVAILAVAGFMVVRTLTS